MAKVPPQQAHEAILAIIEDAPNKLDGEVSMMATISPSLSCRGGLSNGRGPF
jgi:hypothetical protein